MVHIERNRSHSVGHKFPEQPSAPCLDLTGIEVDLQKDDIRITLEDPSKYGKKSVDHRSMEDDSILDEIVIDDSEVTVATFCWFHPEVQKNWRTVVAAVLLLISGIFLLALALYALTSTVYTTQGINFLVGGLLCIIPGAYHTLYIWLAANGYPGFEFQNLRIFS